MDLSDLRRIEKTDNVCVGIFYRCQFGMWVGERGPVIKILFRRLKRLSCSGCDECDWMDEGLDDSIASGLYRDIFGLKFSEVEHGKIYKLTVRALDAEDYDFVFERTGIDSRKTERQMVKSRGEKNA